jgi:hypothetical protein
MRIVAGIVASALALGFPHPLPVRQPPMQDAESRRLAEALGHGTPASRMDVIQAAARIAPKDRSLELWRAALEELRRVGAARRSSDERTAQRLSEGALTPESAAQERERQPPRGYLPALTAFVAQSDDPAVIPVLVDVAGYDRTAAEALAAFGDEALDELLDAMSGRRNSPGTPVDLGAMIALDEMLAHGARRPLSSAGLARIVDACWRSLKGQRDSIRLIAVVRIARGTRDQALRDVLDGCARGDRDAIARAGLESMDAGQVARGVALGMRGPDGGGVR